VSPTHACWGGQLSVTPLLKQNPPSIVALKMQ
jgi:hypothetical protein